MAAEPAEMEFCLLGPLLVRRAGDVVAVPSGKQRVLLAALLLSAGRLVLVDELTEAMWGSKPPPSALASLQNHVMRLRKSLGDAGHARVTTGPDGYLISVGPGELDLHRFESSLAAARQAARAGSWPDAAARLRAALSLWRGQPLAGVRSDTLALREVPRLMEMQLQAREARIDADLHLGRHADVIIELRQLAAAHPLRERLHALLMIALYRDGQQAAALDAYQSVRGVLVEELGAEPGPELRQLQRQVLAADSALAALADGGAAGRMTGDGTGPVPPAGAEPGLRPALVMPRQLPAPVPNFTGRAAELQALTRLLCPADEDAPETMVISAIGGTAGVGKTALAVHWAQQVAERFPDGQLYVNLRGYDLDQPMSAADALAGFLRALGVAVQDVPAETADRAALYRSLLAGRRILVVADNAGSAEQVRPLLPGSPACAAVVTSRDSLAGLVARDGARRLDLDLLSPEEAVGLLRALIGGRVDADPDAAAALAAQCSRLPLALRVAAELAASRPAASLADLAGELADQRRRLDLLDAAGDPRTAVRNVFSWSYRHLGPRAARTFRLLGTHPGPDLDPYAAAALTGATVEQARQLLDELARAHLIQTAGPGRSSLHDLLRAYARDLAAAQDTEGQRWAALTRLFDYYLHAAAAAMNSLFPAEQHRRPRVPRPATPVPPTADPAAARAWLDAERGNLVAVAVHTADHGWPGHATRLASTVFRYLDAGGHTPETAAIQTCARRAAHRAGDRAAEATALTSLSAVDFRQGRGQRAAEHLQEALALFRETGDQTGEARALTNLGLVDLEQGRYQPAVSHLRQALALFRQTGDQTGEIRALGNLGLVDLRLGRYRRAAGAFQRTVVLYRETGDQSGEAHAMTNLGIADARRGRYQQAAGHLRQALALFRQTGNRSAEAYALAGLADVDLRQGRYQQAAGQHGQALALFRETGNRSGEAEALNGLGKAFLATGRPGNARTQHTAALGLASQVGNKYEQAHAHDGLARGHHVTGDGDAACRHWAEALALYTELGAPEADEARVQLAATGRRDGEP